MAAAEAAHDVTLTTHTPVACTPVRILREVTYLRSSKGKFWAQELRVV